jgi:hypothetical protein
MNEIIKKLKENLAIYGKVEQCEETTDGYFAVKITEGFLNNAVITFEVMRVITEAVGSTYPFVKKCDSDNGLFIFQLKKPTK